MKISVEACTTALSGSGRAHSVRILGRREAAGLTYEVVTLASASACQNEDDDSPDLARVAELSLAELEDACAEARRRLVGLGLVTP